MYNSLATITSIPVEKIKTFLSDFDMDNYYTTHQCPYPGDNVLLTRFKSKYDTSCNFDATCWFHGTRTSKSNKFERGIFPLKEIIDEIWDFLFSLLDNEFTEKDWADFRKGLESDLECQHSRSYRLKTKHSFHWGPYAYLIKDILIKAEDITILHDYLKTSEIVEDICLCFKDCYGYNLLERYNQNTKRCIVKFKSCKVDSRYIGDVLWYLYKFLHKEEIGDECGTSFDGKGNKIPKEDILKVEYID